MRKLYKLLLILAIAVLVRKQVSLEKQIEKAVFNIQCLETRVWRRGAKNKKLKRVTKQQGMLWQIYKKTLRSHLGKGCVVGYLCLCTPLGTYALEIAALICGLSSLKTALQIVSIKIQNDKIKEAIGKYSQVFDRAYQSLILALVTAVSLGCAYEIVEHVKYTFFVHLDYSVAMVAPLMGYSENGSFGEFREIFNNEALKIEANEKYYRITIGQLQWQLEKENEFNRMFFALVIRSASLKESQEFVITAKELAKSLGWQSRYKLNHLYGALSTNGGDFGGVFAETALHRLSEEEQVEGEQGEEYSRFYLPQMSWKISRDHEFEMGAFAYLLNKAQNSEGKRAMTQKKLVEILGIDQSRITRLIQTFGLVVQKYPLITEVDIKRQQYKKLQQHILNFWLDDICLSSEKIAKKLMKHKIVEHISAAVVRSHVRNVDFIEIKKRFAKEYQQGQYRKSHRWALSRYQQLINHLLQQLAEGKQWQKAQIERFTADLPALEYTKKPATPLLKEPSSSRAWLKCFLFNLPKNLDEKICCPECGEFQTSRKSKTPQSQIVNDPRSNKSLSVNTFRFYCNNSACYRKTFCATADGSHVLQEHSYGQICTILRLVMGLSGSYHSVAGILGMSKSSTFDKLTLLASMTEFWSEILGTLRFSGTLCIDEKFIKVAQLRSSKGSRCFAYLFFAVDPASYDLLHIDVFPTRDSDSVEVFLTAIKAQGISPNVIMTDLFSGYDKAIRNVFGRRVTITKCLFHFQKNVHKHLADQFGHKDVSPIATMLKNDIFFVTRAKSRKTLRHRFRDLMRLKPQYLIREPKLLPMFRCLENYIPHLLRALEHQHVWILTNNPCEIVIRRFNQRYKLMAGFKSFHTASRHAKLFQIFHRFSPFTSDAQDHIKGRTPLQIAGYQGIEHMPLFQYMSQPLLFDLKPARNLQLSMEHTA